ncbi:TetR/AcrR family transcriptional regulator [Vibrio aestuarianus]|uniref:TetR/AcrR family transcriptional regulator n=1 Tax=Vibrio aestuarianus TaxID=28171 RepID=UPI0015584A85|nr:TetR/AcrR family transcriptional regulator [Vibrio aestuarianus]NGZ14072.1 TetR/AcrR family transcriptional regulator [Vibrio aestuarianus]NKZ50220.1 TetR/AcrR family transcriptional regulator [Vibrio aestuarianus]
MSNCIHIDKYQQILTAAESLIAESGFQGLSMHKLAKKAGVAAGTIYRYFDDKDHLLIAVRLHVCQQIADAVQANVDDEMPLKERFTAMWLNIWQLAQSRRAILSNRVQYESLPITTSCNVRELERKMFAQFDLLFNQGKEQGLFKPLDNQVLSALSFETTVALARKQAMECFQLDEQSLHAVIDASWDAITQH